MDGNDWIKIWESRVCDIVVVYYGLGQVDESGCCLSRLLTLEWMKKVLEVVKGDAGTERELRERMMKVFGEVIEDFDSRLSRRLVGTK